LCIFAFDETGLTPAGAAVAEEAARTYAGRRVEIVLR
jgi:hypothetical protein